ncbi:hypothetical protein TCAL_17007 [Tigriopus californicus]|uniref:Uncharacterized protein n=1 Tax=Tigriopus californicus TaxID=6832 RepID=A0A553PFM3_TIGCA|nr:hypothetical protein TCAL_17007 [Tigriopus californicus]
MSLVNLSGKVAIITGASSGIGAATAILFSKLGASLALTGRNALNLERTSAQLQVNEEQKKPLLIQAVDQLTRCVALELAPKQVRVNCVNPGVTITELQKRGGLSDEAYAKFLERSKETHAMGRAGEPEEVAQAVAFLASSNASFSTGISLPVDGGRHAMCPR